MKGMGILETTLGQINALSEERQHLWRLAGRQRLTDEQRERLGELRSRIDRLWGIHRTELAWANRKQPFIEDRMRSEYLVDYVERLHQGFQPQPDLYAEELQVHKLKFNHKPLSDDDEDVFEGAPSLFAVTWADSPKLGELPALVREVLDELNCAAALPSSA